MTSRAIDQTNGLHFDDSARLLPCFVETDELVVPCNTANGHVPHLAIMRTTATIINGHFTSAL